MLFFYRHKYKGDNMIMGLLAVVFAVIYLVYKGFEMLTPSVDDVISTIKDGKRITKALQDEINE